MLHYIVAVYVCIGAVAGVSMFVSIPVMAALATIYTTLVHIAFIIKLYNTLHILLDILFATKENATEDTICGCQCNLSNLNPRNTKHNKFCTLMYFKLVWCINWPIRTLNTHRR